MAEVRVKYVARGGDQHRDITHVGSDGWRLPIEEVMRAIESGTNTFYIKFDDARAELGVITLSTSRQLRALVEGRSTELLLELPGFPETWLTDAAGSRTTAVTSRG